jgi:hypothetical protein
MTDYDTLSAQIKETTSEITKLNYRFDGHRTAAQKAYDAAKILPLLEHHWDEFQWLHKDIMKLQAENASRSYYKNDNLAATKAVYEQIKKKCEDAIKKVTDENTERDANQSEIMNLVKTLEEKIKRMEEERTNPIQPNDPRATLNILTTALRSAKHKMELPIFPKDPSETFDFFRRMNNYVQHEAIGLTAVEIPEFKLEKMKEACKDHPEAHAITKKFILTENAEEEYNACLDQLQRRFLVKRNIFTAEVKKLIDLKTSLAKISEEHKKSRHIYDVVTGVMANMEALTRTSYGPAGDGHDKMRQGFFMFKQMMVSLISVVLSENLSIRFATKNCYGPEDYPDLHKLLEFIEISSNSQSAATQGHKGSDSYSHYQARQSKVASSEAKTSKKSSGKPQCLFCGRHNHDTANCRELLGIDNSEERFAQVKEKKICTNCLSATVGQCNCYKGKKRISKCDKCSAMHHAVLHDDKYIPARDKKDEARSETPESIAAVETVSQKMQQENVASVGVPNEIVSDKLVAIRPTCVFYVLSKSGVHFKARALIDEAATNDYMTYSLAKKVGAVLEETFVKTITFSGDPGRAIHHQTNIVVASRVKDFVMEFQPYVTKNVCGITPSQAVKVEIDKRVLQQYQLADPTFHIPAKIDMIIGVQKCAQYLEEGRIKMNNALLMNTQFGWIVKGVAEAASVACVGIEVQGKSRKKKNCRVAEANVAGSNRELAEFQEMSRSVTRKQPAWKLTCKIMSFAVQFFSMLKLFVTKGIEEQIKDLRFVARGKKAKAPVNMTQADNQKDQAATNKSSMNDASRVRRTTPRPKKKGFLTKLAMTMMCLAMLCALGLAQTNQSDAISGGLHIHEMREGGILYLHQQSIMLKAGTYHLKINTTLAPLNDAARIQGLFKKFNETCSKGQKSLQVAVQESCKLSMVERAFNKTLNTILKVAPNGYTQRSRRGAVWTFLKWAFGFNLSEDTETDTSHSMGVVRHAVSTFKRIETELQAHDAEYHKELEAAIDKINVEQSKTLMAYDLSAIRSQMRNLRDTIMENFEKTRDTYNELPNKSIPDDELVAMLTKVNQQLASDLRVPALPLDQLRNLIAAHIMFENGTIDVILNVPIVTKEMFEEYFAVPIVNVANQTIAAFDPHSVIVNHRMKKYVDTVPVENVNETLAITSSFVGIFKKGEHASDCAVTTLITHIRSCPLRKLPSDYEKWMPTPLHNVIAFRSTRVKDIVCEDRRIEINETSGVVQIPKGCTIESPTVTIHASYDKSTIIRHALKIEFDQTQVTEKMLYHDDITLNKMPGPIKDDDLDEIKKETYDHADYTFWITLGTIIAAVSGVAVEVLVWCKRIYQRKGQGGYNARRESDPADYEPEMADHNENIPMKRMKPSAPAGECLGTSSSPNP